MVDLALILPRRPDDRWQLARQLGVTTAVIHPLEVGDGKSSWSYDDLRGTKNWLAGAGLDLGVMEGSVPLTDRIRLGKPGRDEDIEVFKEFIQNCGRLDIPIICYDWMAGIRWARTNVHVESRGNSLVTGYEAAAMADGPPHPGAETDRETVRSALGYFLEAVVPVAEEAGVTLALHPDDPPREEVRGIPRIANDPDALADVLAMVDSPANGLTFCQGTISTMGADIPATIRRFGDRIAFVHFRDVRGSPDSFEETWHDAGPTDMAAAMGAYRAIGFDGPMRPDHVPTMVGEDNARPGYHTKGRLFAIGYMRGLLDGSPSDASDQ